MNDRLALAKTILEVVGGAPAGILNETLCKQLGKSPQQLGDAIETLRKSQNIVGFGGLWFTPKHFAAAQVRFLDALADGHEKYPGRAGLAPASVAKAAGLNWTGKPLIRIVDYLADRRKLLVGREGVRLVGAKASLSKTQQTFLDRVVAEIEREPINVPTPRDLARVLQAPPQAIEGILRVACEQELLIEVGPGVVYTPAQLRSIDAQLSRMERTGRLSAARVRDEFKTTRRYALAILTHLRPVDDEDDDE